MSAPRIFIDGDACPVKREALKVAERHNLQVLLVANTWMRVDRSPNLKRIVVEDGPDKADDWIAENITARDVCVTSDIPLAKRCLDAGARVLKSNGDVFDDHMIGSALASRELMSHIRETGGVTYNAAFTERDRSQFLQAIENTVQSLKRS